MESVPDSDEFFLPAKYRMEQHVPSAGLHDTRGDIQRALKYVWSAGAMRSDTQLLVLVVNGTVERHAAKIS